ncbi:thiamine pyrophosphate-binding protein [Agreia sp. VKM Ac-1783]|uniref:thiamine pyrophosphate-binding protein n=1 Tax=Agreia sp. VKM Ac-1783 TaxID=1938889 RepID=UPI0026CCE7F8
MSTSVIDFIISRIRSWGVTRVFGYPGDGAGAFDGALGRAERAENGVEYIRPTHEEICSLMATAHAKFTGDVGVCIATSSPGAFHFLNGLYDAQMDNQPVVAIVGQQGLNALGTFSMQESNLERCSPMSRCTCRPSSPRSRRRRLSTPPSVPPSFDEALRSS